MHCSHRPPHRLFVTPRSLIGQVFVSLFCLLGATSVAWAHDWSELTVAYETGEMEAALTATHAVQATLEPNGVPLPHDAWAIDWWRWFARAAQLDERQGQQALREALASAQFPYPPEDAIGAWRDLLEHLVTASDGRRAAARLPPADALFEADSAEAGAADLVRASYLASLQGTPADAIPEALIARLDALVAAARALR